MELRVKVYLEFNFLEIIKFYIYLVLFFSNVMVDGGYFWLGFIKVYDFKILIIFVFVFLIRE